MIAKEVRALSNMCSSPYDLLTMLELGGQPASNAMVALNQMTTASSQYQAQGESLLPLYTLFNSLNNYNCLFLDEDLKSEYENNM